ncbi:uncharacterized protein CTRU02_208087 [Colletotrichum truncatum]|uniref:Uncharacterized protein n=1 Tax=Colletotrichum truncatum TaxID=5467 RepID=A0ACC3YVA2_COLTU|nr:uncharacterized protein CTRU02_10914 [Colletotrichum truncatum]KAF6786416.1 hypothetical protein CTRU02_10914 [Colletotrichum truncatum]
MLDVARKQKKMRTLNLQNPIFKLFQPTVCQLFDYRLTKVQQHGLISRPCGERDPHPRVQSPRQMRGKTKRQR